MFWQFVSGTFCCMHFGRALVPSWYLLVPLLVCFASMSVRFWLHFGILSSSSGSFKHTFVSIFFYIFIVITFGPIGNCLFPIWSLGLLLQPSWFHFGCLWSHFESFATLQSALLIQCAPVITLLRLAPAAGRLQCRRSRTFVCTRPSPDPQRGIMPRVMRCSLKHSKGWIFAVCWYHFWFRYSIECSDTLKPRTLQQASIPFVQFGLGRHGALWRYMDECVEIKHDKPHCKRWTTFEDVTGRRHDADETKTRRACGLGRVQVPLVPLSHCSRSRVALYLCPFVPLFSLFCVCFVLFCAASPSLSHARKGRRSPGPRHCKLYTRWLPWRGVSVQNRTLRRFVHLR